MKNLVKLLDEESQQSASFVMAELLKYGPELDELLSILQESDNEKLRKRAHQLQSILITKKRRKNISLQMASKSREMDIIMALTAMHMQWYDNDSELDIMKAWNNILKKSKKYYPNTLERFAHFMRRIGFSVSSKDEIEADYYCIGIILEELVGADFVLCAMALALAARWKLHLDVIQIMGDFALADREGQILVPQNGWKILSSLDPNTPVKKWEPAMLLKLVMAMMFLCAASTDSFRYINTLGTCLARLAGREDLEFLPYPYNA
jgi:hypothetical protein